MKDGLRCLTLHEPWASLIASGAKRIETRSWSTSFRGPVGIHAGSHMREEYHALARTPEFVAALGERPLFYCGCVIAVGYLSACFRITGQERYVLLSGKEIVITRKERYFGDYTPGRFGWIFENVVRLVTPYPARGYQGLWTLDRPNDALQEAMADAHLGARGR